MCEKYRMLSAGALLLLTACGGGGGGGESGGSDPGTGNDDPGTTIDKNASVSARSASLALGDPTCPHGGFEIETGIDENGNGLLDDEEVDKTAKLCNGAPGEDGLMALVAMEDEPAGANCPAGGLRIRSGHDANRNGTLDGDEVAVTDYLCNGQNGPAGPAGPAGADGRNSLVTMTPEPAGSNCASGGLRIESGLDTNGNGNLDTGEITQTGYICNGSDGSMVGWSNSTPLQRSTRKAVELGNMAMLGNGIAGTIWVERERIGSGADRTYYYAIFSASYSPDTGTWSLAERLRATTLSLFSYMRHPRISVAPNHQNSFPYGDTIQVAIWEEFSYSTGAVVRSAYFSAVADGWTEGETLVTAYGVDDLQIAMDGSGHAIALWTQKDSATSTRNLMASHFDPANAEWSDPQNIEANPGAATFPRIAMNADGYAVVVWQQWNEADSMVNLWATRYVPGTGWIGLERLDDGSGSTLNSEVAITPDGSAIVVWEQSVGPVGASADADILVRHYTPGTGWSSPTFMENSANSARRPHVAIDSSGNAMAVWEQEDGTSTNIHARRYDNSTSQWGDVELLDTNDFTASSPRVAMNPTGDAMVVWAQSDGSRISLWSKHYDASTATWGRTQLAETDNSGDIGFLRAPPQVAMDDEGNAIAAWRQRSQGSDHYHVRVNRWQAPPAP